MRIECNIIVYQYCIFYSTLVKSILFCCTEDNTQQNNADLNIILGRISGILPPKTKYNEIQQILFRAVLTTVKLVELNLE